MAAKQAFVLQKSKMSAVASRILGYLSLARYYRHRFANVGADVKKRTYISLNELLFGDDAKKIIKNRDYFKVASNYPVSKMVNGRYVTPWSGKTEKGFIDTMKYVMTANPRSLAMPEGITSISQLPVSNKVV